MAITKKQVIASLNVAEARAALEAAIGRERKATEKRNKAFRSLPAYKKRITIAQDVLDQLEAKRLVPTMGTYLEVPYEIERKFDTYDGDPKLKVNEALIGASCKVCGIGSIFVAAVDRANECTVGEMDEPNDDTFMRQYLSDWFSKEQLDLIETAFEGRAVTDDVDESDPKVKRAIAFTRKVQRADNRLRKIMTNIIEHNGEFTP